MSMVVVVVLCPEPVEEVWSYPSFPSPIPSVSNEAWQKTHENFVRLYTQTNQLTERMTVVTSWLRPMALIATVGIDILLFLHYDVGVFKVVFYSLLSWVVLLHVHDVVRLQVLRWSGTMDHWYNMALQGCYDQQQQVSVVLAADGVPVGLRFESPENGNNFTTTSRQRLHRRVTMQHLANDKWTYTTLPIALQEVGITEDYWAETVETLQHLRNVSLTSQSMACGYLAMQPVLPRNTDELWCILLIASFILVYGALIYHIHVRFREMQDVFRSHHGVEIKVRHARFRVEFWSPLPREEGPRNNTDPDAAAAQLKQALNDHRIV